MTRCREYFGVRRCVKPSGHRGVHSLGDGNRWWAVGCPMCGGVYRTGMGSMRSVLVCDGCGERFNITDGGGSVEEQIQTNIKAIHRGEGT